MYYAPQNAVLVISGNVDSAAARGARRTVLRFDTPRPSHSAAIGRAVAVAGRAADRSPGPQGRAARPQHRVALGRRSKSQCRAAGRAGRRANPGPDEPADEAVGLRPSIGLRRVGR